MNYVSDAIQDHEQNPLSYWENTSGNGIIRDFVSRSEFDVSDKFETL
jgi:hypothetical protein